MSLATPLRPAYAGPPAVPGYIVGEFLGRGSSAVVWAATSAAGERVALKVFAGDRAPIRREEVLRATTRELALSHRVTSTHVARAHERVELDDGRVVLALDLADEGSLRDVVTIRGALPLGEVVTTVIGVATGLADLETGGVVHGDLAPGNVLFDADGRPMLADLSSARLVTDGSSAPSIGTSGFVAPEVLAGHPPTPASDVWSLGALLWYARTAGRTPPGWVTDVFWVTATRSTDGPGLERVVEAVGPELAPVVVRMLADDPYARPTAAEVALAVYRAAEPEPLVLVGRHPDPASAVTTRLRREAAETRSRSELRAAERQQERERRRVARRARGGSHGWPAPWHRRGSSSPDTGASETAPPAWDDERPGPRSVAGEDGGPTVGGLATGRRHSVGIRVAVLSGTTVVVAAGLLGLVALRAPQVTSPVAAAATSMVTSPTTAPGPEPSSLSSSDPSDPSDSSDSSAGGSVPGSSVTTNPKVTTTSTVATTSDTGGGADLALADPGSVLQALADIRAAALMAADPVALGGAEPVGSRAYAADVATVARLREQRQRYRDLTFTVSQVQLVSHDGSHAVVRATVGRSASTVEGEDGSVQSLIAAAGEPLRYGLTLTDGGWRLTEVTAD